MIRTFSLNSRGIEDERRSASPTEGQFYGAVCAPRERAWIPNGALPRECEHGWCAGPFETQHSMVVFAEGEEVATDTVGEWLRHVEAGVI